MKTINGTNVTRALLARSHERQFNGEDWQAVAIDLWNEIPEEKRTEDDFTELTHSPFPECDCGFCAKADWKD